MGERGEFLPSGPTPCTVDDCPLEGVHLVNGRKYCGGHAAELIDRSGPPPRAVSMPPRLVLIDPVERRGVRRDVLGGILKVIRGRRTWNVNGAASAASIAPMTWRRAEEGQAVRQRTLTALDGLLGQSFGTVRRALDDDLAMVQLVRFADIDTEGVDVADPAGFLDALAERFRSGAAPNVLASDTAPPMSDLSRAAALVDRITRRTPTPALENAVAAILAAMPDLVPDRIQDALPAVDALAERRPS